MCGKTATYNLKWAEVYAYASALIPPADLPADPENRINISPSRLRRKSEPESMVWETVPVIWPGEQADEAGEAPDHTIAGSDFDVGQHRDGGKQHGKAE